MLKAFIVDGDQYGTARYLQQYGDMEIIDDHVSADLFVYTGGEDISTMFYNEDPVYAYSKGISRRDRVEQEAFTYAIKHSKYQFGICRGHQLLWALNGGLLWQDLAQHGRHGHDVHLKDGSVIRGVTSLHHQAARIVVPDEEDFILGVTLEPQGVTARSQHAEERLNSVVEVMYIPGARCFGVQGHPEFAGASDQFRRYVINHIKETI